MPWIRLLPVVMSLAMSSDVLTPRAAGFAEGYSPFQEVLHEAFFVFDKAGRHNKERAEARMREDRLFVRVADGAYPLFAAHLMIVFKKFRFELCLVDRMDLVMEFFTQDGHAAEFRPEVGVVVCSVKQGLVAVFVRGNDAEESAHNKYSFVFVFVRDDVWRLKGRGAAVGFNISSTRGFFLQFFFYACILR